MTEAMIRERLAGIRCFLLDMDGTFYLGDKLIDGSASTSSSPRTDDNGFMTIPEGEEEGLPF